MTQPLPTICGWKLATGLLCFDDREAEGKYCPPHEAEAVCQGCGKRADHACEQFLFTARCIVPLCPSCEHKDGSLHGPRVSASRQAHDTLVTTAELAIADAVGQGLLILPPGATERPAAEHLIEHLTAHTLLQIMSGIASTRNDSPPGRRE